MLLASRANLPKREDGCRILAHGRNEKAVKESGVTLPIHLHLSHRSPLFNPGIRNLRIFSLT